MRGLWHGVPLNTNLCYSNPAVREMVVDSMVEYLAEHPEVDLLHFWLADGSNNQCECPACRDTRPADYYVMMLNALDRALAARGIDTRIVFLVYVDLLWPPERERIANPERFVLMFAPITRSYRETFATAADASRPLPPYERNRLTFPSDPSQNVAFLRAWQETFGGDSFDFDYHLWRGHYMDPGHLDIARVLGEDIGSLAEIGLNGYVSCQVQRAFFPSGLPMHTMAARLWDRDADLGALEAHVMREAYGADAPEAVAYLRAVTEAFRELEPLLGGIGDRAALPPLERLTAALEGACAPIARNLQHEDSCVAQSWLYLDHHRRLLGALAAVLEARARGDERAAADAWERAEQHIQANEDALQPVFDVWGYLETMRRRLGYSGPQR